MFLCFVVLCTSIFPQWLAVFSEAKELDFSAVASTRATASFPGSFLTAVTQSKAKRRCVERLWRRRMWCSPPHTFFARKEGENNRRFHDALILSDRKTSGKRRKFGPTEDNFGALWPGHQAGAVIFKHVTHETVPIDTKNYNFFKIIFSRWLI